MIESETVGLPNLLARRMVVPELHQSEVNGPRLAIARELWSILEDRPRQAEMSKTLLALSALLEGKGCLDRAARAVLAQATVGRSQ